MLMFLFLGGGGMNSPSTSVSPLAIKRLYTRSTLLAKVTKFPISSSVKRMVWEFGTLYDATKTHVYQGKSVVLDGLPGIPLNSGPTGFYASQIPKQKAIIVTAAIINPRASVDAYANASVSENAREIIVVIEMQGLWFMGLVQWFWFGFHLCTYLCCFLDAIQSLQCNIHCCIGVTIR
jgi:hypothetical protein